MPIDEVLAARVRSELTDRTEITERRMFGGLAFLANGQILVAVSRTGSLLVRLAACDRSRARTPRRRRLRPDRGGIAPERFWRSRPGNAIDHFGRKAMDANLPRLLQ